MFPLFHAIYFNVEDFQDVDSFLYLLNENTFCLLDSKMRESKYSKLPSFTL